MALKTTLWDPSEYLDSPESIAAYLEAAFEDGDPALIATALGDIARAMGMTQLASQAGVTREALYKALSPTGDPRLSTFLGVMKALGLKFTPRAASPTPTAEKEYSQSTHQLPSCWIVKARTRSHHTAKFKSTVLWSH